MRILAFGILFFSFLSGFSNRYLKHFKAYQQYSFYKEQVYGVQDIQSFFQLKDIQQQVGEDDLDIHLLNACIFFAANKLRVLHHLPPLLFDRPLLDAAAMHSYQMATHHFFEHENAYEKKLRSPEMRMRYAGIKFRASAENCAKETFDADDEITYIRLAEDIVEGWYNSPGHRSNLMNRELKYMAVAAAIEEIRDEVYIVVTQDFYN